MRGDQSARYLTNKASMPELPEVETIARALRDGGRSGVSILGRTIQNADVFWQKTINGLDQKEFDRLIAGQIIVDISRRAKYICLQLTRNWLFIHLRMSGDLRVDVPPLSDYHTHDRLALNFTDGTRLVFNDARKFGRVWLETSTQPFFQKIGMEPFDESLTAEEFLNRLKGKKRQIKPLLLDQSFIAGLGNIYTDESLHMAGIHPKRTACDITASESEKLLCSIRETLRKGIEQNGASIDWVYRGGDFQNNFRVYHQTGKPCLVCGNIISRIVVSQRGTHFCPVCQPEG
jgi:formamidopyrimidine-DNA glycosylase